MYVYILILGLVLAQTLTLTLAPTYHFLGTSSVVESIPLVRGTSIGGGGLGVGVGLGVEERCVYIGRCSLLSWCVLLGWATGNERAEAHTRTPSIHTENAKKYK